MDYKKAVKDKEVEFKDLFERMDDDADLANLSSFTLEDVDGRTVPKSISITLNDPAVFAANVESSLGSAVEQITVESEDEKIDTDYIEDAIRACFAMADNRLTRQGKFPLNPHLDQMFCRRGPAAARCLFRMEDGQLVADILPWDTRYVTYAIDADGLAWAAYKTTRSKDAIEAEYPGVKIKGKSATVLDVWYRTHNERFVDDAQVVEEPHNYGQPPVVIQSVPLGSMLVEKDGLKHQGESIFFLIRDLSPELNRLVSIIQSLNMKQLDNALLWFSDKGTQARPPKYEDLTSPGSVVAADKGGGAQPVDIGQLKQQAYLLHSMIETRIQRGSLSNFEYGTFTQPMSAVALITVGEGRDQVFLPRLGARGLMKQRLADMFIDQIIKTGERSIEIGTRGHRRTFEVSKLQGEYETTFKYFVKSPKIDAARYALANASDLPRRMKWRDILQLEDPDEAERWKRWEEAEDISVTIKLHRTINNLLEMAERGNEDAELEAEILAGELGVTLEQIKKGILPTQHPERTIKQGEQLPKDLLPIFGQGPAKPRSSTEEAGEKPPPESEQ